MVLSVSKKPVINGGGINNNPSDKMDQAFWEELKRVTDTFDINLSGKLLVLDKIIKYCSKVQDKL